jgi:hypothetical protein
LPIESASIRATYCFTSVTKLFGRRPRFRKKEARGYRSPLSLDLDLLDLDLDLDLDLVTLSLSKVA